MPWSAALCLLACLAGHRLTIADDRRPSVHLTLMTGDRVDGVLLSFTEDVVVLEHEGLPYGVSYSQMAAGSAYRTKLQILARRRGGKGRLQAVDHNELAMVALEHGDYTTARRDFALSARLDGSYAATGDRALREFRRRRRDAAAGDKKASSGSTPAEFTGSQASPEVVFPSDVGFSGGEELTDPARRARIIAGYKAVGDLVREQVGSDLVLLETPHFLIWTDWAKAEHGDLRAWCERMYTELARRFGVSEATSVFAGKCPVFCLRSRKRFAKVAALLDDYDVTGVLGYTSWSGNGHVHVVVCRQGGSPAGRRNFTCTLIHEGTHAFLHRYRSFGSIPGWLKEGFADYVAEAVLGDRCQNAETAEATAREIVKGDYGIAGVFGEAGVLEARHYPVAHSLVSFLIHRDGEAFVSLIDDMKGGVPAEAALNHRYDLSLTRLEALWRQAHE